MSPSQLDFLRHIQEECGYILQVTQERTKRQVVNDPTLKRSIVKSLEIIGEAVKRLDKDITNQYPGIEWSKIAGTRDKLTHHYFGIDYDIVWDIVKNKIPVLNKTIEQILAEEG